MSEYHVYECDKCGDTTTVWCESRIGARRPRDWEEHGNEDWCKGCVEDELADLTAGLEDR